MLQESSLKVYSGFYNLTFYELRPIQELVLNISNSVDYLYI